MPERLKRLEHVFAMQNYHDLIVWQRGFEFVREVYTLSTSFPKEEAFGLTNQLRRAAVSIIGNIAEGRGKATEKDFYRFLSITRGSLNECQCYLELAQALTYITKEQYSHIEKRRGEIGYLLFQLMRSINQ